MIMGLNDLPFTSGQVVESRSFIEGYRGAWFRCKIHDIGWRLNQLAHLVEYLDYPDEEKTWINVYERPLGNSLKLRKTKPSLMVRPSFPTIYQKSKRPEVNTISEVVVIVTDTWRVGDLVDWYKDGCFWSGTIIEILGKNKVKIELPPPPAGEGTCYYASCKDLRPSLDWSPECGWTVPTPTGRDNGHPCAQIIDQAAGGLPSTALPSMVDGGGDHATAQASQSPDKSKQMEKQLLGAMEAVEMRTTEKNMETDMANESDGKTRCSNGGTTDEKDRVDNDGTLEEGVDEKICPNLMSNDSVEVAVLDLEGLLNRVKWMKGLLEIGLPLSNSRRPPWKFLEHRVASTPK